MVMWLCLFWAEWVFEDWSPTTAESRDVIAVINITSADQTVTIQSHIQNGILPRVESLYDVSAIVSHCVCVILLRLQAITLYNGQVVAAILLDLCASLLYSSIWYPTDEGLSSFSQLWNPLVREQFAAEELKAPQPSPPG